jgi:hypothetical protein
MKLQTFDAKITKALTLDCSAFHMGTLVETVGIRALAGETLDMGVEREGSMGQKLEAESKMFSALLERNQSVRSHLGLH